MEDVCGATGHCEHWWASTPGWWKVTLRNRRKKNQRRISAFSAKGKWRWVETRPHLGGRHSDSSSSSANNLLEQLPTGQFPHLYNRNHDNGPTSSTGLLSVYRADVKAFGKEDSANVIMSVLTNKGVSLRPLGDPRDTNSYVTARRLTIRFVFISKGSPILNSSKFSTCY